MTVYSILKNILLANGFAAKSTNGRLPGINSRNDRNRVIGGMLDAMGQQQTVAYK